MCGTSNIYDVRHTDRPQCIGSYSKCVKRCELTATMPSEDYNGKDQNNISLTVFMMHSLSCTHSTHFCSEKIDSPIRLSTCLS